jgi:formylglycine-generating enzyme required for sulfatase activity
VAQFQRFLAVNPEFQKPFDKDGKGAEHLRRYSPAPDGPIVYVDWYTAAAYCNWLSRQEGIPQDQWVYPTGAGAIRSGMAMPAGYLRRTGYRLPTEAEWEYACRAEAPAGRYYGGAEELLPRFAWYRENAEDRAWPVGQKKPNDFGLFDMHGNVWTWCQDRYGDYPQPGAGAAVEDREEGEDKKDGSDRVVRGGAYDFKASSVRSAFRNHATPIPLGQVGLRLARTVP